MAFSHDASLRDANHRYQVALFISLLSDEVVI